MGRVLIDDLIRYQGARFLRDFNMKSRLLKIMFVKKSVELLRDRYDQIGGWCSGNDVSCRILNQLKFMDCSVW